MLLRRINLLNYKNYGTVSVAFDHKFNLINGLNGSGKTNLMDSIYYLCLCKSYFTRSDNNVVKHDSPYFRIDGFFDVSGKETQITCKFTGAKKEFFKDNVQYDRLADHIGLIPVVMIAPDDIAIINSGSEERRRFVDTAIAQLNPEYLSRLIHYNKVLQQRNAVLKHYVNTGNLDNTLVEVFDKQLAGDGDYIYNERKLYLDRFADVFSAHYRKISGDNESCSIVYVSQLHDDNLMALLKTSLRDDLAAGRTTMGIHKDDLKLFVKGYPVRDTGSQGQIKSFLIAMKIAQCKLMEQLQQKKSIMLLDDVFEKLDKERLAVLFEIFAEPSFEQIFITDADEKRGWDFCNAQFGEFGHFRVSDNNIE